ncbi:ATP phosphoribosyltransferase regulatory subunit [Lederbergia galactosidilytica]|uniref:ATP phosphoribosyltransferase regulatory subunit n=1 Tax=Lederbergia galactosidilytica TaxID=217031 RepID=A0A0Q9Y832_9BACI|nr:ATP phosphoribosyltransferase regulatory subunit [Lederbergia galactosidilytica]KRG13094.1 tRNA synthetase class II [Virgibacillus soli]KRG16965.1 tRNA synthetase class II [Lederbergia galactosidilytica]MBP1916167.1 ATP phosphoribosyltransferase regulatory subunit [Lederbergia galactosidilytica]OAK70195.1 tRNA synthetase class II [Lederbergia galactosidilytica]
MFLPAGSRDEMGTSIDHRFRVTEVFRKVITMRGYSLISTPVVEYAATFTNQYVDMKLQDMMKWFNPEGEIEVLRPDWTTSIARALSNQAKIPQKWAYIGSIFKQSIPGIESQQIGVETLHLSPLMGESESLLMASSLLRELQMGDCLIELGHTEIFESLVRPLTLSEADEKRLRQAMHDKKKDEVYQIALNGKNEQSAKELASLVDAFGSLDILSDYEERWKDRKDLLDILDHLKKLARIVEQSGNQEILIDLGRVKNLPYYSGTMFRGFLKETGADCFSGGRYDRLYEQFGERISAVGLAFDVDVLAEHLVETKDYTHICIIASEDTLVQAEELRMEYKDAIVDIQTQPLENINYDLVLEISKKNGKVEVMER